MILITGGAGFIGSHLADALLAQGQSVRVIDNLSTGKLANLESAFRFRDRFEFVRGDIQSSECMVSACIGVQAIFHLAAQVSVQFSIQQPQQSAATNVSGFINVLEVARSNGVRRVIYASSAAVYGHPVELPLIEDSPVNPISPYGLEKSINEQYARLYSEQHGLSCLGLRFFNVYGPRQDPSSSYAGVISKFFQKIRHDEAMTIFGDGRQTRDFVHVADIARICTRCLEVEAQGVLALGTGHSVTLNRLVQSIAGAVGRPAKVLHANPAVGDILHSTMDPSLLWKTLGISAATDLDAGLADLWHWIKVNTDRD